MDAPYQVLANLLRVKGKKKYSIDPFNHLQEGKKRKKKSSIIKGTPPLSPTRKVDEIKSLGKMVGVEDIGNVFDDFYYPALRNSISHSDYVLHDNGFRMLKGLMLDNSKNVWTHVVPLDRLGDILTKTYAFYWAFFSLEIQARKVFKEFRGRCFAFDTTLKGLLEFLVDDEDVLYGFKVHWPNKLDSVYSRSKRGCKCTNIRLERDGSVNFFVGEYFREHEEFSRLVPKGKKPEYTSLKGSASSPSWPGNAGDLVEGRSRK